MPDEMDYYFDEIGAGLKVRQMQKENRELFSSLELYHKALEKGFGGEGDTP